MLYALLRWWLVRRIGKRDSFRETINPILRKIQAEEALLAEGTYRASVHDVRDACAKFEWYVLPWYRHAFAVASHDYCNMNHRDFEPICPMKDYPNDIEKLMVTDYQPVKNRICAKLNRLIALSV